MCGIDPGVTGALVLVDEAALQVVDWLDMPVIRAAKTTWSDGAILGDWLEDHRPQRALVELIHFWPGMPNASGAAVLCRVAGGVETMLSSLNIPFEHVQPAAWQRREVRP